MTSFDTGRVREWIGPRIVPVFADEVEWDITSTYEPLIMVQHEGETFMSRQYVPAGIELPNTAGDEESNDYWVHMSNWNAQVEYYRQEVLAFDGRIDALEDGLPIANFDSTNTVKKRIDDLGALLPESAFDSTNTIDARFDAIEANGWVTTDRINNNAITSSKIADGGIATVDIADSAIINDKIANNTIKNFKLETQRKFKGCSLACIGDSFLAGYSPGAGDILTGWGEYLSNCIQASNYYEYAQGSSGYHRFVGGTGNRNFYTILDEIYAAHPDIDVIVIGGGWNDIHTSGSDTPSQGWLNYGVTFAQHARTLFPNAFIACFLPLCGYMGYGYNLHQNVIKPLATGLARGGIDLIHTDCWDWLWQWESNEVSSDGLHPTDLGQRKIGAYMSSVLNGSDPCTHVSIEQNVDSNSGRIINKLPMTDYSGISLFREGFDYYGYAYCTVNSQVSGAVKNVAEMNYRGTNNANYYHGFLGRSLEVTAYGANGMRVGFNEASSNQINVFFGNAIAADEGIQMNLHGKLWAEPNE